MLILFSKEYQVLEHCKTSLLHWEGNASLHYNLFSWGKKSFFKIPTYIYLPYMYICACMHMHMCPPHIPTHPKTKKKSFLWKSYLSKNGNCAPWDSFSFFECQCEMWHVHVDKTISYPMAPGFLYGLCTWEDVQKAGYSLFCFPLYCLASYANVVLLFL